MKKIIFFTLLFSIFISTIAQADIGSDLNDFFQGMGLNRDPSSAMAYKSQQGGFYGGGGIYNRNSMSRNTQIADIKIPSFQSGCGGIDLFSGGHSFVNADEIKTAMMGVMGNTVGYVFNLALETTAPEVSNVMKYIEDMSNQVNNANLSSCEAASSLTNSVWSKTHAAEEQSCEDIGTSGGAFTDWSSARQNCGPGGDKGTIGGTFAASGGYKNSAQYQGVLKGSGNVAWKAIQQNGFLRGDTELAEFFMSLSGTVIVQNKDANKDGISNAEDNKYTVLNSLASNQQLINALLHGGKANIYRCDTSGEDGCLKPSTTSSEISHDAGLQHHVLTLLQEITKKIRSKNQEPVPLTSAEIGLLESTSLPIYKVLDVNSAFAGNLPEGGEANTSGLDLSAYADLIATDMLFQYLNENLSLVANSAGSLQYPDAIMSQFNEGVKEAQASLRAAQQVAYAQLASANQVIQQTQVVEQMLAGTLSSQMTNSGKWADTMRN